MKTNKEKRKQRKKKEAKVTKEFSAPLKEKCSHYYVHLGGMKTHPFEQFYQCTECGKRLST